MHSKMEFICYIEFSLKSEAKKAYSNAHRIIIVPAMSNVVRLPSNT